jgi:hypothetical protein
MSQKVADRDEARNFNMGRKLLNGVDWPDARPFKQTRDLEKCDGVDWPAISYHMSLATLSVFPTNLSYHHGFSRRSSHVR